MSHTIQRNAVFKSGIPFTDCISEIKNTTQVDNAEDLDVAMSIYNLIEYSDSKTLGIFWQYCTYKPALQVNRSSRCCWYKRC